MFRQKKIVERLPLSTGVGEGSRRLKKILKILLISFICVLLALCPLSASAVTSNGITFTAGSSNMFVPKYGNYGATGITQDDYLFWVFDYPFDSALGPCEFFSEINLSSSFYGIITITYSTASSTNNSVVTTPEAYNNVNGLYGLVNGSRVKLCGFTNDGTTYTATYKGNIPRTIYLNGYFNIPESSPYWMIEVYIGDIKVEFLTDTDGIINNQNANTDKITQNQDENTDKIVGAIEDQKEQEKQEANGSGNDSVDMIEGALSKYSTKSIFGALSAFVAPIQHNNTDCILTMPAIKIPELKIDKYNITIPSITLLGKQEIVLSKGEDAYDNILSKYFPRSVVLIIRWLFTIVLYVFCFKELYSLFEYVLTLRKGGLKE